MSSASSPCCAAASTPCATIRCSNSATPTAASIRCASCPSRSRSRIRSHPRGLASSCANCIAARNYRPIADTIHELLEATRAHAGFAFRKGGERVLANVFRLTDLARSFEAGGAATSFRAFVEYLESEYESGDTGEAPVLEQEGGGVKLMTVHKAKGLEFPVVILADLTAKLTGPQGGDRYCDPDRRLCAQRLLWCAPWELLDAAEAEAKADEEEALRVAYVAATRARDLLVVAAIGEEDRARRMAEPAARRALSAEGALARSPRRRPAVPSSGAPRCSIVRRINPRKSRSSRACTIPRPAATRWSGSTPPCSRSRGAKAEGVENEQVLKRHARAGRGRTAPLPGMERPPRRPHRAWQCAELPHRPPPRRSARARKPRDSRGDRHAADRCRAVRRGRKFGRVVHDILQHASSREDVDARRTIWGRRHGASELERAAAADAARAGAGVSRAWHARRSRAPSRTAGDGAAAKTAPWWTAASISPGRSGELMDGGRLQNRSPREAQRRAGAVIRAGPAASHRPPRPRHRAGSVIAGETACATKDRSRVCRGGAGGSACLARWRAGAIFRATPAAYRPRASG